MEIGKVVGSITSVSKIDELKPVKLFLVQLLDGDLKLKEDYVVAIDPIGVGSEDMVIITGEWFEVYRDHRTYTYGRINNRKD